MKWSKQEVNILKAVFALLSLSICRRVKIVQLSLLKKVIGDFEDLFEKGIGRRITPQRTLEAIRSKARRMGLIKKNNKEHLEESIGK
jgi:hypothetical protein